MGHLAKCVSSRKRNPAGAHAFAVISHANEEGANALADYIYLGKYGSFAEDEKLG